jgi:hypothetical protein
MLLRRMIPPLVQLGLQEMFAFAPLWGQTDISRQAG